MRAEAHGATGASAASDAGHRLYTPLFLSIYDPLVLWLYSNRVWRCPVRRLVEMYSDNLRRRHLDVGPGTGYFLTRARLPQDFDLTLLDPNPHVLAYASHRLEKLNPTGIHADVREPLPRMEPFESAALNYVLHCLPGPQSVKTAAVRGVADVLAPDGVLFGASILGEPQRHSAAGRAALHGLNRKGIFDNRTDTEEGLRDILTGAFHHVTVDVVGSAAVFTARSPRRPLRALAVVVNRRVLHPPPPSVRSRSPKVAPAVYHAPERVPGSAWVLTQRYDATVAAAAALRHEVRIGISRCHKAARAPSRRCDCQRQVRHGQRGTN